MRAITLTQNYCTPSVSDHNRCRDVEADETNPGKPLRPIVHVWRAQRSMRIDRKDGCMSWEGGMSANRRSYTAGFRRHDSCLPSACREHDGQACQVFGSRTNVTAAAGTVPRTLGMHSARDYLVLVLGVRGAAACRLIILQANV